MNCEQEIYFWSNTARKIARFMPEKFTIETESELVPSKLIQNFCVSSVDVVNDFSN